MLKLVKLNTMEIRTGRIVKVKNNIKYGAKRTIPCRVILL